MTSTDLLELLRTCPEGFDRFQAREFAHSARLEELTALLQDPGARPVAARVLALRGDEAAVPALAEAARRWPGRDVFEALVDCGPAGRAQLRRLAAEPGTLGAAALYALGAGFSRAPLRPALWRLVAELGAGGAHRENLDLAGFMGVFPGWLSTVRRVVGEARFEAELDQLVELRVDPPSSPLEALPLPCVARLRARNLEALKVLVERRQSVTREFLEDLAGMEPAEAPTAGRNDPCPCGSGRKFKKCCLDRQEGATRVRGLVERCREAGELVGLPEPPTRSPESARLLELLGVRDARGPWAREDESPRVRWVSAWSRLRLSPGDGALDDCLAVLDSLPAPGVEAQDALLGLILTVQRRRPQRLGELVSPAARLGAGPVLGVLAAALAMFTEGDLAELLEEVCAAGRGPGDLMSILEAAMRLETGAEAELAEEALPFLRHAAAEDPAWEESVEAVLEWMRARLWWPVPSRVEFPPEVRADRVERFEREEMPEELSRLARRLRLLCTWPEGFEDVSEDSREPLEEERRLRTELALRTAEELEEALRREDGATALLLAEHPGDLFLLVGEEGLDWMLPEGAAAAESLAVAGAAGILAAELGLDLPSALQVGARVVLRQEGLRGREMEVSARVALEEACAPVPELRVRVAGVRPEGKPAPVASNLDAVLAEKARRAGLHPLELAAELRARGRTPRQRAARLAPPEAPVLPVPLVPEPVSPPSLAPPVALADDPVPARKALRRALRRLLRTGKIGEAHTSVHLVSRGVVGHLRGAVKASVDLLLARGVLREKPTLVGQHTSIEPRSVPAVERFVEEGWLPAPGLEVPLGLAPGA